MWMLLTGGAQEGQTEALKIQPTREKQNKTIRVKEMLNQNKAE